nr:restriction endonuclease [uncultured Bacteroides sp.]
MEYLFLLALVIGIIFYCGYRCGVKEEHKSNEYEKSLLKEDYQKKKDLLNKKFLLLNEIRSCSFIFEKVASLYTDLKLYMYDETIFSLENRQRPAFKAADEVKQIKAKSKDILEKYKVMSYKYEFLINQFPELKEYVDDYEAIIQNSNNEISIEDASDLHDRVKDWIRDEDYKKLDANTRNQLALDNWLKHRKMSNAQVGYEYELFIGFLYKQNGWQVEQNGIDRGLEDLGRDIIAKKMIDGRLKIHIIQCKRWSEKKEIHENVVNQLYGTTIQYILMNKQNPLHNITDITPVLTTTAPLSKIAQSFADYLKVSVKIIKMGDYPRIKCNINQSSGEKIYHLPFDQQYYSTKINMPGEFFASTVKEAANKGFRRAFRHLAL